MRAYYFQRLTARVFHADPTGWMLKGGHALLIRYATEARLSRDIDLQRAEATSTIDEAVQALLAAAAVDLGDYLTFTPTRLQSHGDEIGGASQHFDVQIGTRRAGGIKVDLVVGRAATGAVQTRRLEPTLEMPWPTDWPNIQLYPVVDHIADKVCAMYERHNGHPSSRFRDLADILLISQRESVDMQDAKRALEFESGRRQSLQGSTELTLPSEFTMPDESWRAGYPQAAKDVSGLRGCRTWGEVESAAHAFLTPLLGDAFIGEWNPKDELWIRM